MMLTLHARDEEALHLHREGFEGLAGERRLRVLTNTVICIEDVRRVVVVRMGARRHHEEVDARALVQIRDLEELLAPARARARD